jgi:tetratricopeptide (TPR) repeat protein
MRKLTKRPAIWAGLALLATAGCGLNSKAYNATGVRMYEQAQYTGAVREFQQAIYADPVNADGYYNLAATLHKQGMLSGSSTELEQAESYYNQCLDRDAEHRDAHRGLAVLLTEQERSEEAFRLLEGWCMRFPGSSDAKVELARLYQEYGDKNGAKEHLLEALAVNPNDARALAALGRIHEETGNQVQALSAYQRSLYHNRLQPEVAARVAALQPAFGGASLAPPAINATRTVSSQPSLFR